MQSHIDTTTQTTTQLDLVRGDAAARQRRAATYRFVHEPRPSRGTSRRSLVTTLAAVGLALGVVTGAAAINSQPLPHGYEAGQPDGWFDPTAPAGGVSTAETSIAPAPTPLRQGYAAGQPDGWYEPASGGVQVAGVITPSRSLVPGNVR